MSPDFVPSERLRYPQILNLGEELINRLKSNLRNRFFPNGKPQTKKKLS